MKVKEMLLVWVTEHTEPRVGAERGHTRNMTQDSGRAWLDAQA